MTTQRETALPGAAESVPWYAYLFLCGPKQIQENLARIRGAGLVTEAPNLWQISLGVLRMWHRVLFRFDTVGTCASHPMRPGLRPKLLQYRPLRFPFLVAERAIAPLDFSGLASHPDRIVAHLLAAHHDGNQFAYDLQLLTAHPGRLEEVLRLAEEVLSSDTPRSRWLRDLVVFEGYHESLHLAVTQAIEGNYRLPPEDAKDPDISFVAYLSWCAAQPKTPGESLRALLRGDLSLAASPRSKETRV